MEEATRQMNPEIESVGVDEMGETPAQKKFRADLNHQLRTPLNAIVGFAELLVLEPSGRRS
ncbi:MAG: two-component sensor histidine kinase, partial [Verrucomicrobiota bacterium]|nr:two-component sensor histidine kinase [Verrucomicrobiota bacterium]